MSLDESLVPAGPFTMRFKGRTVALLPAWIEKLRERGCRRVSDSELIVGQRATPRREPRRIASAPATTHITRNGERIAIDTLR